MVASSISLATFLGGAEDGCCICASDLKRVAVWYTFYDWCIAARLSCCWLALSILMLGLWRAEEIGFLRVNAIIEEETSLDGLLLRGIQQADQLFECIRLILDVHCLTASLLVWVNTW